MKNEFHPFAGVIKDLSWSSDNQRIVAVGEGREKFGHVFMMETGTSVGEIAGHSKVINSCDFRPTRPFRIITGGEDNIVGIYEGPPFKFKFQLEEHNKYVQSVRFSPNGELFASGGFDGKIYLYKANDYSLVGEIGSPAHNGGVYAIYWSPNGSKLLSASGDRAVKIWDIASKNCVQTYNMGEDLLDQQVSCLWQGKHILSVSLSGFINYLDENNNSKPIRVIKGHNKSITSLAVNKKSQPPIIYTGSHDGFITHWNSSNGENDRAKGNGHQNQVQDMKIKESSGDVITVGLDDTLKIISGETNHFKEDFNIKLTSQPKGISFIPKQKDKLVVVAYSEIIVLNLETRKAELTLPVNFEPSCVSVHPSENYVAVGARKDNKVHVFEVNEAFTSFTPKIELEHRDGITDIAYSPNGEYLAACDANRKVVLYNASNYELAHNNEWGFHTARVNCLSWCPDSSNLASGSLDTGLIIWNTNNPTQHLAFKSELFLLKYYKFNFNDLHLLQIAEAHPQSQITRIEWLDTKTLISVGQDSNVKIWTVNFK